MEEKELMWPEKEVSNVGEVFVQSLVNMFWYIDGHHSNCNERNFRIQRLKDFVDTTSHISTSTESVQLKTCHQSSLLAAPINFFDASNHAIGSEILHTRIGEVI